MGDITINGKNVITQSGSAEPVIASNVTGGAGLDAGDAGTLTGVLPVGVTGGSGLTALGTVTTGNLSNSAIVYPAGHVLNSSFHRTTLGYTTHATASWSATLLSSSYTFKHANSSLIVLGSISWAKVSQFHGWRYCRIMRGSISKMEIGGHGIANEYSQDPCNFEDSGTHAVGDVWTYDLQLKSTLTNVVGINQIPHTGYKTSFTFFEIAT